MAGGSGQHQAILKVARQLQRLPHNNPAVAQTAASSVAAALELVTGVSSSAVPRLPEDTARPSIIAALQSAGWLLQAAKAFPTPATSLPALAAHQCICAARRWIDSFGHPDLELLKAVTQPSGDNIPGRSVPLVLVAWP
jgi:hypothetical protein